MQRRVDKRKWLVIALLTLFALFIGLVSAVFGGVLAMLLVLPLIAIGAIFKDYRIGVLLLAVLLPWTASPLLPQAQGLNMINYLTLATLLSFGVPAMFGRREVVALPKPLVWFYLMPLTLAFILAVPHLPEAVRNYSGTGEAAGFELAAFAKGRYLKPLMLVVFAYLLANAMKESVRPERFFIVFVFAALMPALAVFVLIAVGGVSLGELQAQRNFMGPIGMHANEMALCLVYALGPILFVIGALRGVVARFFCMASLVVIVAALLLTFSRGGFLAMVVVFGIYMLRNQKITTLFVSAALISLALLFAPTAIKDRLSTGVEEGAVGHVSGNLTDPLTAGRVAVWEKLAPEVLKSPIWGKGLGSTAWSDLVRSRVYLAVHPHNMYLAIVLDLGVLGLALFGLWYFRVLQAQRSLEKNLSLSPVLRSFMGGAFASLAGALLMCLTNGDYYPKPEQTFFWFSIGVLMMLWPNLARNVKKSTGPV